MNDSLYKNNSFELLLLMYLSLSCHDRASILDRVHIP